MNYKKIYDSLCYTRKTRGTNKEIGFEVHHIIPKCMGGKRNKQNLVKFTYKEHFLTHYLLTKIYPDDKGINYAFLCMIRNPGYRKITGKQHEIIKKAFSRYKKEYCKILQPGKTQKSREKARLRMLTNNPNGAGAKNTRAKKTKVVYFDGTEKIVDYAKSLTDHDGIPYSSIKIAIRHKKPMVRYGIKSISYYVEGSNNKKNFFTYLRIKILKLFGEN